MARDLSGASWRFKIKRAQKHFVELQSALRSYNKRHPYRVRWERQADGNADLPWRANFYITRQPSDELALIIGDVVHNVRTALDHLVVAITGNDHASFPIARTDPFQKDGRGNYVDTGPEHKNARSNFKDAIKGMPDAAKAIIKDLQPYALWPPDPYALRFIWQGSPDHEFSKGPEAHYLSVLSRLDNIDKHRDLITIATAVIEGWASIIDERGLPRRVRSFYSRIQDGTEVAHSRFKTKPKMKVKVTGPVEVLVRFGSPEGPADVSGVLNALTNKLHPVVFDALEPFVP